MDIKTMSALELAFVGDAVYELEARRRIAERINTNPNRLHRASVSCVCASAQSEAFGRVFDMLSDDEKNVARRGRNATKTSVPKNSSPEEYRQATALEALFGYLYLTGAHARIAELADVIFADIQA